MRIFAAVLCIVCILALCIAPFADIPVTVLKALQVVIMLMFGLMSSILVLAGKFHQTRSHEVTLRACMSPTRCLLLPLETNCVQLC